MILLFGEVHRNEQRTMSKRKNSLGLPPGSIVYTGSKTASNIPICYIQYDQNSLVEKTFDNHSEIVFLYAKENNVDWYDVRGIHDSELIEQVGKAFEIHPLILEDISNVHQRPTFEEYEKGLFIVVKAISFDKLNVEIKTEQVSIYIRKGLVVSFQETESDLFKFVRKRVNNDKGRIRRRGADYLAYALVDVIVDHYFVVLEEVEAEIEALEEQVLQAHDPIVKSKIHKLKKELLFMRKSIAPLREAISRFSKSDSSILEDSTVIFIRDLYDHTIQVMDSVESFRDLLNGLHDLFISEVSFKMNQVVQVLTIVSTIFIPLTFLAGIYGMNFEYIPELKLRYGYFIFWGVLLMIFCSLIYFFKKKKWF